jgi:cysteine-rich repeat protein/YVTN family beta-propeller protein
MAVGVLLGGLVASPPAEARSRVYVVNLGSISVIDPFTNTVLETLPISGSRDIVATPDGSRVYVNSSAGIKVVDTSTNTVVATVPTSSFPDALTILPDGSRIYAVTAPDVSVVDTATNTVVATIPIAPNLSRLAAHPDGSRVYLSRPGPGDDAVAVIDTATNTVTDMWDVFRPVSLSVHPDGDVVYVGPIVEDYLEVRDADTGALIETLELPGNPVGVVFSPNGLGFIANGISPAGHGYVSILNPDPGVGVTDSVGVGKWIYGVAISPDGRRVYTTSRGLDRVSVFDAVTMREATRIAVGEHPRGVAVVTTVACGDAYRDVGEGCDDGNLSNGDGCSSVCQLEIGCPASPDPACHEAGKGLFFAKEPEQASRSFKIKLWDTPSLTQSDFGNPLGHGRTAYALCIYDHTNSLVEDLIVDLALENCRFPYGRLPPCWTAIGGQPPDGKGYRYRNFTGVFADGVSKMTLKGGAAGRSKALIKGFYFVPVGLPAALQNATAVTVQFRSSDGACLSAELTEIKRQSSAVFRAKTP